MKRKCLHKANESSSDTISKLPETVLEAILCLLPTTKEAARTSILSREWRYKWTKLPKLEFRQSYVSDKTSNEKEAQGLSMDTRRKPFYHLHQILLLHQGTIQEFSLHVDLWKDYYGLDQILLHLAKNHKVKKLTLYGLYVQDKSELDKLPISAFSFSHLTDLNLFCFDMDYQPTFNGFRSLQSLFLYYIGISTKSLLHLLSNCPSLKNFSLRIDGSHLNNRDCTIIELFKCLPVIEDLAFYGNVSQWLVLVPIPRELPSSLSHLKSFCITELCFDDGHGLAFLLLLIKCSPNLEKIRLSVTNSDHGRYEEYRVVWKEYSGVWLKHLIELQIHWYDGAKLDMNFVKFILARSPKLKKVSIDCWVPMEKMLEMLQVLLRAPRASPNLCLKVASKNFSSVNILKKEC